MACARNTFSYNDVHGGGQYTGAVAIMEGMDTVIANNVVHDGVATIWLGYTRGSIVENNIALGFSDWMSPSAATVIGNSWQA